MVTLLAGELCEEWDKWLCALSELLAASSSSALSIGWSGGELAAAAAAWMLAERRLVALGGLTSGLSPPTQPETRLGWVKGGCGSGTVIGSSCLMINSGGVVVVVRLAVAWGDEPPRCPQKL